MQQLAFSAAVVVAGMALAAAFSGFFFRVLLFFMRALFGLVGLAIIAWLAIAAVVALAQLW